MSEWIKFRKEDLENIDNLAYKISCNRNINEMIAFAKEAFMTIGDTHEYENMSYLSTTTNFFILSN